MSSKVREAGLNLTKVAVKRQASQVTVILQGRGRIQYKLVSLHSKLVALDFPDSISSLGFNILPVRHHLLKDVRIEQHPQRLRLAFALVSQARYAIKTSRSALAIQFRS